MPLDPIHTIRAARRLHLKAGVFVSLAPPEVFAGHLRAVAGKVAWMAPSGDVERGEEVLECWGSVVLPGLALAGIDPLAAALRALPEPARRAARDRLEALPGEDQRALALQSFAECASAGVLAAIVDLRGASALRARATAAAAEEAGLRAVLEWNPNDPDGEALARELAAAPLVRVVPPLDSARIDLAAAARGGAVPPGSVLSAADAPPDALALVRLLEARERGLGFRALEATYAVVSKAFGAPFGRFARGAPFDAIFVDFEPPARLAVENVAPFLLEAIGPWCFEAAAVATRPVVRRHEVITVDREAVARRVAELVEAARG